MHEEARRLAIANILFLPHRARQDLGDSLAAADVHLSCLLPAMEGFIVPSKFCGILAAGRPVIVIGDPDGEQGSIVRSEGCGDVVASGDAAALVQDLRRMRADPERLRTAGVKARAVFARLYTMGRATSNWISLLNMVAASLDPSAIKQN
jgi:glycosyltransferase involved in cell wall biosynthesis